MIAQKYWQRTFIVFVWIALAFVFVPAHVGGVFQHSFRAQRPYETAHGLFFSFFSFPQTILHQFQSDDITPIPEEGAVAASKVIFGVSLSSAIFTPLRLQVEVYPSLARRTRSRCWNTLSAEVVRVAHSTALGILTQLFPNHFRVFIKK